MRPSDCPRTIEQEEIGGKGAGWGAGEQSPCQHHENDCRILKVVAHLGADTSRDKRAMTGAYNSLFGGGPGRLDVGAQSTVAPSTVYVVPAFP